MMDKKSDIRLELMDLSKLVAELPVTQVFTVPSGYFEQFPDLMLEKVRAMEGGPEQELFDLSPLLAGMSRKMPMSVPEGYFQTVSLPAKDSAEKSVAPVVSMPKRRFSQLAIAASIVAILGFGGLLFNMMKAPDAVNIDVAREMPKVSEKEMDDFLQGLPDVTVAEPIVFAGAAVEADEMLSEVDEAGLQDFLADQPDVTPHKLN